MKVVAAVLVAGKGERFGMDKMRAMLGGKPLWKWSFDTLAAHPEITGVGLVCSLNAVEEMRAQAPEALFVVAGGQTRKESSQRALGAMPADTDVALIQDGARPFVSDRVVTEVIAAAARCGAAAPGLAPTDTIKQRTEQGLRNLPRENLVAVQTPQALRPEIFRIGHELLQDATDDLALAEAAGVTPEIVDGDPANIKITLPEDLARAESMIAAREHWEVCRQFETRTGIGYDIHALSVDPKRTLFLGGLAFPGERALEGHSDADVLLHAITDALLGAAGLGDIGQHFPDTDPRWRNEPSSTFVSFAAKLVRTESHSIVNVDATVIAERPKLAGRMRDMEATIASLLAVDPNRVNLKATTNEGLGSIGRGEGIAAMAVVTIRRET